MSTLKKHDSVYEWKTQAIDSLCLRVTSGGTPSRSNIYFYTNGHHLWIKTKELKEWYISDSEEKITDEALEHSSAKLFPKNTILMAMYGDGRTITSLGIVRKEAATNQACCALIVNPDLCDHLFLFYLLKYHKNDFIKLASGGSQRNLNGQIIKSFKVKIPELSTQQQISAIISSYDYLIENNEKRIKALEEMAQLLYTEWFVKFKFPGHKKVKMVDSDTEYGMIPEGWEVKKLGDKIQAKKGKNITQDTVNTGNVPVVAGGLEPAYFHDTPNTRWPVITISASGANAGFTRLYFEDVWASDCSFIDSIITKNVYFYYLFLKYKKDEVLRLQRGSAQPHVYPKDLMELRIIDPSATLIDNFEERVATMFNLVGSLKKENINFYQIRDLLIPQLVTGKRELKQ